MARRGVLKPVKGGVGGKRMGWGEVRRPFSSYGGCEFGAEAMGMVVYGLDAMVTPGCFDVLAMLCSMCL